jgi:hypothetical protein
MKARGNEKETLILNNASSKGNKVQKRRTASI